MAIVPIGTGDQYACLVVCLARFWWVTCLADSLFCHRLLLIDENLQNCWHFTADLSCLVFRLLLRVTLEHIQVHQFSPADGHPLESIHRIVPVVDSHYDLLFSVDVKSLEATYTTVILSHKRISPRSDKCQMCKCQQV